MAVDNYQRTYSDTASRKESVLAEIEMLSALEDGLLSSLPKSSAINTVHSTLTDTLRTVASKAVAEGADASLVATTTPSRVTNLTQIVSIPFGVSGTQNAVDHFGFDRAFSREAMKAMEDWKNATEFDLVRSTLVSGASGTVTKMAGIIAGITTNATAMASGTIFSETIMNGLFQLCWENGNGEVATDIYVGAKMKRKISGFAGRTGTSIDVGTAEAVNAVDVYVSDFGVHRVHLHRFVFVSGTDATQRFLALRPEKWAIAYLRQPKLEPLAKVGDSERAQVIGELTLENKNEKTNIYANGFHLTS